MKHIATPLAVAVTAVTAALALAACGSGTNTNNAAPNSVSTTQASTPAPPASGASSGSAQGTMIMIKSFKFSGAGTVAGGTKVTVMNTDAEAHTLTSDDGKSFNVTINPGAQATFTAPSKAGNYTYHCNFHSNMHGSLKVS